MSSKLFSFDFNFPVRFQVHDALKHSCSMHGMPFHLQQWRPGPFPFTLYAVKLVGPLATASNVTPVLVRRDATAAIVVNEMRETAV